MATKLKTLRYALPLALLASVSGLAFSADASTKVKTSTAATTTTTSTSSPTTTSTTAPVAATAPTAAATTAPLTNNPIHVLYGSISPLYGSISPLYGSISPLYGSISPLYGSISPLWGSISPLWGSISPLTGGTASVSPYMAGNFQTNGVSPFWGTIKPYQGAISGDKLDEYWQLAGTSYQKTLDKWNAISPTATPGSYGGVATDLQDMVSKADEYWKNAVLPKGATGTFKTVFADPLMAKYGIDPTKPATLAALTPTQRALFFLDWYDGLMNYTGTDHIDHWMRTANWSPSLTQIQGSGADTTIGLLDFTVAGDVTIQKNIIAFDGVSNFTNGHGAAVASLMVGAHDGKGVMGIAPRAKVVAYNPFDSTGTASWDDVATGIKSLAASNASIINASLGEPGYALSPGWNAVFSRADISAVAKNKLFVLAAGNDGIVQTSDVTWDFANNPNLLIVGSVQADGVTVSNFNNQPGAACLVASGGTCQTGNRLMDHYLVAPGELILVSDDKGGVIRQTGTSLAAPLVSGAIALLHDRWPWLATYPKETSDIILKSAKDLGAPGVDPIFGAGLLDITASQSPLDFGKAVFYTPVNGKLGNVVPIAQVIANRTSEQNSENGNLQSSQGLYYYAFESIGNTKRDFGIPLAKKLIGQSFTTAQGSSERFQDYLIKRLDSWIATQTPATAAAKTGLAFSDSQTVPVVNPWGADMTLSIAQRTSVQGFVQSGADYQSKVHVAGEKSSLDFGFGDGAIPVGGMEGFALAGDVDATRGGMDPLLGLASGGGFANLKFQLSDKVDVSAGMTHRDMLRDVSQSPALQVLGNGAERYQSAAGHFGLNYRLTDAVQLMGAYTHLQETGALLGTQSLDRNDFGKSSSTDGVTVGVNADLGGDTRLALSGTVGKTAAGSGQNIAVDKAGVTTSAYEAVLTRSNLLAHGDVLRMSLSQPMHVESGKLNLAIVEVTDRQTGEIGIVNHTLDLHQARPFAAEVLYGRPVLQGAGDVSLYGRADTNPIGSSAKSEFMGGARFRVKF